MAGNFNFTMSSDETWGLGNHVDHLYDYFVSLFEDVRLIDIVPNVLVPTWSNSRCGGACISKRLDRFFMVEDLCDDFGRYRL